MSRRGGLFARFSLDYADHPKIAALSDAAFRAHVEMILYSRKYLTDGRIPNRFANRFGFESLNELMTNCETNPSITQDDDGDYWLHDFAEHQETRAEVEARRLVNAENGKRGGRPAKRVGKRTETQSVTDSVSDSGTQMKAETETETETDIPPNPQKGDDTDDHFETWWDTYDNKKSKPVARRRWKIALKKTGVTPELLIDAARRYITHQRSIGKHPEFTKNPGTWLNQECWNDELTPQRNHDHPDDDGWSDPPTEPAWLYGEESTA